MSTTATTRIPGILTKMRHEWANDSGPNLADYGHFGLTTGTEVLTAIKDKNGDSALYEAIMGAQQGNDNLQRVILQAFLPKALLYVRSHHALRLLLQSDRADEALCCAITGFWEATKKYPSHRTVGVASRLTLEALHCIDRNERGSTKFDKSFKANYGIDGTLLCDFDQLDHHKLPLTDNQSSETSDNAKVLMEVMRVLQWSIDNEVLTQDQARMLGRHTIATADEKEALAQEWKITKEALSKKVHHFKTKLARAISRAGLQPEIDL